MPGNALIAPHLGERSFSGYELNNINDIDIGFNYQVATPPIHFYNLDNGILSLNSSASVRSCTFELITTNTNASVLPYMGFSFTPSGLCIGARAAGIARTIDVGTPYNGPNPFNIKPACSFLNSTNGIYMQGNINATITENTFTGITNGASQVFTSGYTASSIASVGGNNNTVNITANNFTGFNNGVNVRNKRSSTLNVTDNFFNSSSGTGFNGVLLERATAAPPTINSITIARNEMRGIRQSGINVFNERNVDIYNNDIQLLMPNLWPGRVTGISLIQTNGCQVTSNKIEMTATPTLATEFRALGILLQTPTGNANRITSNHMEKTGRGLACQLVNTQQTVECNNFDQNRSGVYLFDSRIGPQLGNNTDQNNKWAPAAGAANRNIVAMGTTPLFSNAPANPNTHWFFSGASGGTVLNAGNMTPTGCVGTPTGTIVNIHPGCPTPPARMPQQLLVQIINEQDLYDTLASEELYWAKKQAYYLLAEEDSLMLQGTTEDTLLATWFDSTANANIGLLKQITDSADSNIGFAMEINNGIAPSNHAEENEVMINNIYLLTWAVDVFDLTTSQYEILYAIAMENPLTGGSGVYAARIMLGLIVDDEEGGGNRIGRSIVNTNTSIIDDRIHLMPNPGKEQTWYSIQLNNNEEGNVELISALGLKQQSFNLNAGENYHSIDLSKFIAGLYYVKTTINSKVSDIRKLVVIK